MTGLVDAIKSRLHGRTRRSAFTYSLLFGGLSIVGIIVTALTTKSQSTGQTISFAILGAILQTSLIGLLYEVLLRQDVENDAFDRLNLSMDIRRSGLARIVEHGGVDWPSVLGGADDIVIVTPNPARLLGSYDTTLLQPPPKKRRVFIAVSRSCGSEVKRWTRDFEDRWKRSLPIHELIGYRLDGPINYEVVAYGETVLVLLPASTDHTGSSSSRILEFHNQRARRRRYLAAQAGSIVADGHERQLGALSQLDSSEHPAAAGARRT